MGISIRATNSPYSFDMGCGGFFNLRKNIALCLDKSFGENYANICQCHTESQYELNDKKAEYIINKKGLWPKYKNVISFLYMPDDTGSITHKTCKQIYDLIKSTDFGNKAFQYASISHNDYEKFKLFLKYCYSHRCKMKWS